MEVNREEIIKALECCANASNEACKKCPINDQIKDNGECCSYLATNALTLIKDLTPQTGGIISKEDIKKLFNTPVQPIPPMQLGNPDNDRQLIRLIEQLNGLLDRYNALYNLAIKYVSFASGSPAERLNKTLENIEEAIAALCLRITEKQCIVTVK